LNRLEDTVRIRGLMVNITEHKRSVRLERERNQILELIARNVELEEVMTRICELAVSPFQRAACVIAALRGGQLELLGTYGLAKSLRVFFERPMPTPQFQDWMQQLEQSTDLEPRLAPDERLLLQKHDLKAIKTLPIVVSGHTVGVVSVLLSGTSQRNFRLLHSATELCAIAIDRNTLLSQLEYRATHDPLTDLPNRALYQERLTQAMQSADNEQHLVGLLYIDLDNFKFVNDHFSHATGDELLKNIARQLQQEAFPDSTVARLGGDEFAVILPKLQQPEEVIAIAQKLQNTLTTKVVIGTHQHEVSASIGTAIYPRDGKTADELSNAADRAMYGGKKKIK
jgi:diguanylate cyclase (GGDEF)-like protein